MVCVGSDSMIQHIRPSHRLRDICTSISTARLTSTRKSHAGTSTTDSAYNLGRTSPASKPFLRPWIAQAMRHICHNRQRLFDLQQPGNPNSQCRVTPQEKLLSKVSKVLKTDNNPEPPKRSKATVSIRPAKQRHKKSNTIQE